ncbi:MAG: Holliday junction branch migration protein RuvA [Gammaproteobacteria bacterium]|nr:Holliday junction branch migration protein RuvA [Gammaproteobacteria bacterium]MBT8104913.1 Holliday junction branch migration protein RuvA [Gammaproteobacteria bacterium]NNF48960.1 Holliday junction branch migration protein RuvA [Woeseiaceae bacterium]NNK24927.1 Holliday junction branch migration protein RuvA [Woeseiaceae bacterium]NNL63062.1 Holliday junction branch migration protein RuvA [Woeseiaceae bacterium]
MIGSLQGRLAAKHAPHVVVECAGVGYEVETPMSTFLELPEIGADIFLNTHMLVREDAQILYGFSTAEERALFRMLLKVNRVGAKVALAVLSSLSPGDFRRCIDYEDTKTLAKVPGVGPTTAKRLVMEMNGKVDNIGVPSLPGTKIEVGSSPRSEAFDALVALGYKPAEVNRLLEKLDLDDKSAEDIIRQALKQVAA